jgi:hypothetical protein
MNTETKLKEYAVVQRWKDNPDDFAVWEVFYTYEEAQEFIKQQPKSDRYTWEVAKYD